MSEIKIEELTRRSPCEADVRVVGEPKDRVIRFCISDETRDRYNSVVSARGWQLENYLKNPVMLWSHDSSQPSIAQSRGISFTEEPRPFKRDKTKTGTFRRMWAEAEFAGPDVYPFADVIFRLYQKKFLRAVSIGWKVLKHEYPKTVEEIDENPDLACLTELLVGDDAFTKNEMYEFSGASIPGNPNALMDELACMVPALRSAEPKTNDIMVRMASAIHLPEADALPRTLDELFTHVRALLEAEKQVVTKTTVSVPTVDPISAAPTSTASEIKNGDSGDGGGSETADEEAQRLIVDPIQGRIGALEAFLQKNLTLIGAELQGLRKSVEALAKEQSGGPATTPSPEPKRSALSDSLLLRMTGEHKKVLQSIEAVTKPLVRTVAAPKLKLPPSVGGTVEGKNEPQGKEA